MSSGCHATVERLSCAERLVRWSSDSLQIGDKVQVIFCRAADVLCVTHCLADYRITMAIPTRPFFDNNIIVTRHKITVFVVALSGKNSACQQQPTFSGTYYTPSMKTNREDVFTR